MNHTEGLIYYPSRYEPPLGHAGFEIRLTGAPVQRYFDARRAFFPVEQSGVLRRLLVEHPYRLSDEFRFTSGRIRLEAHDGDYEEVVTFGGHAAVSVEGNETVCRVTSTAPFLPLDDDLESPFVLLESELEIVLARSRAGWGRDEARHLDRMGELEPMTLFVASIRTLEERLERLSRAENDPATRHTLRLAHDIHGLLDRAGEWPASGPELTELL